MDVSKDLLAREAIRQQLCNYGRGVDRRDRELLRSVWHEDGTLDYSMPGVTTPDQLIELLWSTDEPTDVWLHPLTAIAIERARLFQEAKLAEIARLVGDIGHDIKNMLMPIICGTGLLESEVQDLLRTEPLPPSKAQAMTDLSAEVTLMVRHSTRRIQDRMKEIAECVKGRSSPPNFAPCEIRQVIKVVFETLNWVADEKRVVLRCEGLDQLPTILADEHRLFNAFYNLVNNAIPEVPPGGSVTVRGRPAPQADSVLLEFRDTGRGMVPEVRDSLFTTRVRSTKSGGTGLGTKIVKDVVDAHGGAISVSSELGVGTTFSLRLPLQPLPRGPCL